MTRRARVWGALVAALAAGVAVSFQVGDADLDRAELRDVLLRVRGWRLGCSLLAGAALGVAGVLVQGLFRNPLASPSVLGTTAGASLGGVSSLLLWASLSAGGSAPFVTPELALPLGCFAGALLALVVLLAVTRRDASTVTVLLTGFVLSSLFLSAGGLLMSLAQDTWELGRAVVAFTLGGVDAKGPQHLAVAGPWVAVGGLAALSWAPELDVLSSGEDEAAALGVEVGSLRLWTVVWSAVLTAAAVAVGGNVAFVGLVVPHALRSLLPFGHRELVVASAIGGAAFLTWADILVRALPSRGEIPLGVVTGLVGAPLFLVLLIRARRGEVLA